MTNLENPPTVKGNRKKDGCVLFTRATLIILIMRFRLPSVRPKLTTVECRSEPSLQKLRLETLVTATSRQVDPHTVPKSGSISLLQFVKVDQSCQYDLFTS